MLTTYLKIAMRNLAKNKTVSFINIFGLALSMSVGLMILIRIQDAFSYDTFHTNEDRIYRITSDFQNKQEKTWHMASTPLPLAPELARISNSVESIATVYPAFGGKATAEGKELSLNGVFTEPSFFTLFNFPLLAGNPLTALSNPNCIILGSEAAIRFFGTTEVIGKVLTMENGTSLLVTGVMKAPYGKSHLTYDAYVSLSTVPFLEKNNLLANRQADWFAFNAAYTYVLARSDASMAAIYGDLTTIAAKLNSGNTEGKAGFKLQALKKISPGGDYYENDNARGTSWTKIYIEGTVALLILLAACFNYTNLTIARALTRAKEVGIRKIAGAKRYQIYLQYLAEALVIALLSLALSSLFIYFIVRYAPFNDGYEFIPSTFHYNPAFFIGAVGYAIFTGLLAGFAPARILSSFKPLRVLKNLQTAKIFGKINLQKTLIVFQYSLSLVIIIFLSAFYQQFAFMAKANPGFTRERTLIVPITGLDEKMVINQLKEVSGIASVAAFSGLFTAKFSGESTPAWIADRQKAISLNYYYADQHFIQQMQLSLAAGNNFPLVEDSINPAMLINETAVRRMGFANIDQAVGQQIITNDSTRFRISGILKDFNYEGMGREIAPLALRTRQHAYQYLYIQAASSDRKAVEKKVSSSLVATYPKQIFTYQWLDEVLEKSNAQTATISLLGYLGFIALTVATLGLLGLVMYSLEVKGKEISIRKVVGASQQQLVTILSAGFIKLLVIAGLLALPIGWFLGKMFLQNFSQRIDFSIAELLVCFFFLFTIGLIAIISQTYRAAHANPVDKLRSE